MPRHPEDEWQLKASVHLTFSLMCASLIKLTLPMPSVQLRTGHKVGMGEVAFQEMTSLLPQRAMSCQVMGDF